MDPIPGAGEVVYKTFSVFPQVSLSQAGTWKTSTEGFRVKYFE